MSMLDQRLQVLVDRRRMERLRAESERCGAPVGELVRRAIDEAYPERSEEMTAREAADRILAHDPGPGREPDWEDTKERILESRFPGIG